MLQKTLFKIGLISIITVLLSSTSIIPCTSIILDTLPDDYGEPIYALTRSEGAWFLCDVVTNTLWKLTHQGSIELGEAPGTNFLTGGTWIPSSEYPWWAAEDGEDTQGSAIWKINAEGTFTQVTTNCGASLTGLEYNPATGQLYGCSVDALYSIDMETGDATLIGLMPGHMFITIAISLEGHGYGIDISTDCLYKINLSNAVTELIGSLGINLNYAQDCAFDYEADSEILYLAAYTTSCALYICDINTGSCTLIGPLSFGEVTAFAIAYGNQPPIADFTWIPEYPIVGETVLFNASASHDPDGNILWYDWDWDSDGVYDEFTSSPFISHIWFNEGEIPATLRVWDDVDGSGTTMKTVIISDNTPPLIDGPSWGIITIEYTFCFTWTNPEADDFYCRWNWDDGTTSEWLGPLSAGQTYCANHSWSQKGTYEISVTLRDSFGVEITSDPHLFTVYEVKKTFLMGFITDFNESEEDRISFKATLVWYARFNPFIFGRVIPNEELFALRDYKGHLGSGFILGMFDVIE